MKGEKEAIPARKLKKTMSKRVWNALKTLSKPRVEIKKIILEISVDSDEA